MTNFALAAIIALGFVQAGCVVHLRGRDRLAVAAAHAVLLAAMISMLVQPPGAAVVGEAAAVLALGGAMLRRGRQRGVWLHVTGCAAATLALGLLMDLRDADPGMTGMTVDAGPAATVAHLLVIEFAVVSAAQLAQLVRGAGRAGMSGDVALTERGSLLAGSLSMLVMCAVMTG